MVSVGEMTIEPWRRGIAISRSLVLVALCSGLRIFTGTRDHRAWSADQCRSDPQLRWRLTDIAADSFTWRGESPRDSGVTWHFDEQMLATRVDVE
jgi:hypothetical protein